MPTAKPALFVLLACSLTSCSTTKVQTHYPPGAVDRLNAYHTYSWLPEPANSTRDQAVAQQVQQSVDRELTNRGYKRDDSTKPDFFVGWHTVLELNMPAESINGYYGYDWDPAMGTMGYGGTGQSAPAYSSQSQYTRGTLILDVVDGSTDKLLWRGTAQTDLSANPSTPEEQKKINDATKKLLERFPPQST